MAERHPFNLPGDSAHYAPDRRYRAEHLMLELTVDPPRRRVEGTATYTLRAAQVQTDRPPLLLDAAEMDIAEVSGGGAWTHRDGVLEVEMPEGDAFTIAIRYSAEPRKGMYFLEPDEGYPGRPRQIWTQGQAEDTRYWVPSFDFPNQKLTTEMVATVPEGLTVVSNGKLEYDAALADGWRRWHFRQDVPHPAYLLTFVAGEFSREDDEWRGLPVYYFVQPGREADGLRAFGNTPRMMEFFSEATGVPYPYAKYAQTAVADFIYGGMENTSATTQTDRTLHDERAHLDFSSDPLVSHELAHQWFGDLVTCREWGHAWLNEGFATYFECLWREHDLGYDEFLFDVYSLLQTYLGEDRERYRRPIVTNTYGDASDLFDRHLYEKGGLVLHMLRNSLGDEAWWACLKHYLERHRGGSVTTPDLARAIEDVTGRNLDRFFQQWVYSGGHPELKVSYAWDAASKLASIGLKQAQAGKDGATTFDLASEVVFVGDSGERLLPFRLDTAERTLAVHLDEAPRRLRFDPGFRVAARTLEMDVPGDLLRRQLVEDPDVVIRIEAARALGKKSDRDSIAALAGALGNERFWGVQANIARALGETKDSAARDVLLGNLALEHPKARRAVVEALGSFHQPEVAEALAEKARQGDASYFVEAETYRSLGKTRQTSVYDTIVDGLSRDSHDDVIRAGVFDGLKELRDDRAVNLALEWAQYGKPPMARAAAVRALEKLGEKETRVDDLLTDLLDDQRIASRTARAAAVGVLRRRKRGEAIPTLDRVAERDVDERIRRGAREALRALREGSDQADELRDMRERLDGLADENRKLRERLDKLEAV
ncbi:MAG: M1 family metallopeptidase [Chloroflexi bacterium]|nr:M1 family metallopeptidase [Chloroflexota bacterium]